VTHSYKGFRGEFDFDSLTSTYQGEVVLEHGRILFTGISEPHARRQMEAAVDNYLESCEREGIAPSMPRSGKTHPGGD
jgi:predicted HicB family RNase H-like nuclease